MRGTRTITCFNLLSMCAYSVGLPKYWGLRHHLNNHLFFFLTLATWEHVCVVKNLDLSVNAPLLPCLQSPLYKLANMFMSFSPLGSLLPTFYSQKVRAQDAIYWSFLFFFWKIISEITLPSQHTFIQLILSGIILLLITSSNSFFLILRHVHYYTAEALSHTLYHTLFSSRIILFQ